MSDNFENMFEQPFRDMEAMSDPELKNELTRWRNLWTWVETDVQQWLTTVGKEVIAVNRRYERIAGLLGQPHFELTSFDIDWIERLYHYVRGEATYETKTTTVKIADLIHFSVVHGKEVMIENVDGSIKEEEEAMAEKELV